MFQELRILSARTKQRLHFLLDRFLCVDGVLCLLHV